MKLFGFSAGGAGYEGNVDRMVAAVMEAAGGESRFVKLSEMAYSPCKGCVTLCAKPQECMLADDLRPFYAAIPREASGLVIGSPVYFEQVSAHLTAFLERFFAYRHVTQRLKNLPVVAVIAHGVGRRDPMEGLGRMLKALRLNLVDVVRFDSRIVPCLSCGRHTECRIGGLYHRLGEEAHQVEITPAMFHRFEDDPETAAAVTRAGATLRAAVGEGA